MKRSTAIIPAVGVGTVLGGILASRRTIDQWRHNPDPLDGRPVRFVADDEDRVALADGAEIATYVAGSGPTIVLVHGLTTSHHDWGPMAPELIEAGYQVVAIDQRGHGNSTAGKAGYGAQQLGSDLADVLAALSIRPTALVGHSMGAMAALGFAVTRPEQFGETVSSFVAIASAGATNARRQNLGLWLGGIPLPERLAELAEDRLRVATGLAAFGARPSLHMVDEVIAAFLQTPEEERSAATRGLHGYDVLDQLDTLTAPSLLISAGRDQIVRPRQVAELHRHLPNSELFEYPDAGHMVIWERHGDLAWRIDNFIKRSQQRS